MAAPLLRGLVRSAQARFEDLRWRGYYHPTLADGDRDAHLCEAAAWLCRAQDAGGDRGVARSVRFGDSFAASYPETTGYIIPTFLALERSFGDRSFGQRAVEAALWEVDVQLPSGAVMAGRVTAEPRPAVFNTGQVLIGWAALGARGGERVEQAARAACSWMMAVQEPDGRWIRGNEAHARTEIAVYNVKAAWGLCAAGVRWNWPDAVVAAVRNAGSCLASQLPNGWFRNCCLSDADRPLLHTLAYSVQGLLGIWLLTKREDLLAGATKAADALAERMAPDGFLPGRFTSEWRGAVDWCCLTGTAQMSAVWSDLYAITGDDRYHEARSRANRYLVARHDITHRDPAIRGGVPGSWPTSGAYGRFSILNWATKFFVDALLAEQGRVRPHVILEGDATDRKPS